MTNRLRTLMAVPVLGLLVCSVYAVSLREAPEPDLRGPRASDSAAPVKVIVGPYIQNVTPHSATVIWQSDSPARGEVTVSDGRTSRTLATTQPRRFNQVLISDLSPDTRYTYTVSVGESSASYSFKTFPNEQRPVRFMVYGDTRTHPDRHNRVIDAMASEPDIDFVVHTGDLVDDGRRLDRWIPQFLGPAHRLMAQVPLFAVLGNHEKNSPYYFQYLELPMDERWYSFDVANVHIIALDSNSAFDEGSQQYGWLIADLASHKDSRWKFVVMHHPTYTSGNHGGVDEFGRPKERAIRWAQELFPQLAHRYGIAAFFAGHDHTYERSVRDGVNYIVAGGGGAPTYGRPNAEHNPYSKVFYPGIHYCVVTVNGKHAEMIVKTPEGKVLDEVNL